MDKSFFAVGIGASAGGQASLCEFFDNVSENLNVAFIVITHLMRDKKSMLSHILSSHTAMPVIRVEKDIDITPRCVYVLAENTYVEVNNGRLKLMPRDNKIYNSAVDIFFNSLADDFKNKSVGIILSGGGQDGLQGALNINKAGGIVIAEDPASAKVNGMPLSIAKYDHPIVLMQPAALAAYVNHICNI